MKGIVMHMFKNQGCFLMRFVLIAACVFGISDNPLSAQNAFVSGDGLRLTIWQPWKADIEKTGGLEFNGDYLIDSRGYVAFPLIGDIRVVTQTRETLSAELQEKFGVYFRDPVIIVDPLIRVTLLGAFRKPGTYLIKPDASLWELVALAEGPSADSNMKKMRQERGGNTVKKDMLSGFENSYSLQEMGVRTGDQIYVPEKTKGIGLQLLQLATSVATLVYLVSRVK
jgi:protein involved in polysaccharide export with SLBB domain